MRIGTCERPRISRQISKPSLPGQADVEQHHPDLVAVELDQRVLAGPHPDDAVAIASQVAADELSDGGLVFDEENGPRHCPPKAY